MDWDNYLIEIILISSILILFLKDKFFEKNISTKYNPFKKSYNNSKNNITSINNYNKNINYFPYKPKPNILTEYELKFYILLKNTLKNSNYIICPKVRLSDILVVYDSNEYLKYYDLISMKSVDFLLCDKESFKPEIALILDDTNMELDNPFFKYDELTLIFKASALKLIRFKKFHKYEISDITEYLNIKESI